MFAFKSTTNETWSVVAESRRPSEAPADVDTHYLEAVKDDATPIRDVTPSTAIPRELLPLPPLPEGFRQWVYRGKGWVSPRLTEFCFRNEIEAAEWRRETTGAGAAGYPWLHYIEAVREPIQCRVGACYVECSGDIAGPVVESPAADEHDLFLYYDGCYYRTVMGRIFFLELQDHVIVSTDYVAEITPQ